MLTQEIVSTIKEDYAPDIDRVKILSYLDRAQKELYNQNSNNSIFFNRSDPVFPWPILQTQAGVLSYDLVAANFKDGNGNAISFSFTDTDGNSWTPTVRFCRYIFIICSSAQPSSTYSRHYLGDQFTIYGVNSYFSKRGRDIIAYQVPLVENLAGSSKQNAKITFAEDQGDTTDQLYAELYMNPIDLTAENVPLCIDGNSWAEALIDGVNGYIEAWRNGAVPSPKLQMFREYWKPKYLNVVNKGYASRGSNQIPVRDIG